MEKYYEKKAIRKGAIRKCKSCKANISRYNDTDICVLCSSKIKSSANKKIRKIIDGLG